MKGKKGKDKRGEKLSAEQPYSEVTRAMLLKYDKYIDSIIPYFVIGIAILLILDNPFYTLVDLHPYEAWIQVFDLVVIVLFAADLVFKWYKVQNLTRFLRMYWIDVLAVFPFYLLFRTFLRIRTLVEAEREITRLQQVTHEALLVEEEAKLIKEAKLAREAKLLREVSPGMRMLRAVQRFFRVMKGRWFLAHKIMILPLHKMEFWKEK